MRGDVMLGVALLGLCSCGRTELDGVTAEERPTGLGGAGTGGTFGGSGGSGTGGCTWEGFAPEATYDTHGTPQGIAVADFDRNGQPDLAAVVWGSLEGSVHVFLHAPGSSFAEAGTYPTDIEATDVVAGDFDADGYPDLAVATLSVVDLFFNQRDGTFGPFVRYDAMEGPLQLVSEDFDRDGCPDLVILSSYDLIGMARGGCDGSLAPPATYATSVMTVPNRGVMADAIRAHDLDGDGFLDLAVTNTTFPPGAGLPVGLGASAVGVLLNLGNGTFAPQVDYATGNGTTDLAVGDLDGEGHADLAVSNAEDDTLGVLFNAGDGTFGPQRVYPNGAGALGAGDFDGDGWVDLGVATSGSAPEDASGTRILFNLGGGQFDEVPPRGAGEWTPAALAVADLNDDGIPDLAVPGDDSLRVLISTCR